MQQLTSWVLSDGSAGMENQCIGLSEAVGIAPVVKRIRLRSPWRQLSPFFRLGPRHSTAPGSDALEPPWPDLLISCGRAAVTPALGVRHASRGKTFAVHLQDPQISPRLFDLVVVPLHDKLRGPNVITTKGALHQITPQKLADAAARLGPAYEHLPHPRIAVLIGGTNKMFRMTPVIMGDVAEKLANLAKQHGAGLLVTPSRRTGADNEAILRARMRDVPSVVWDGEGENPYFAFLALADVIVVTSDSVSMVSEACSTGKPVYIIELDGGSPKFQTFHRALKEAGIIRTFTGELDHWNYEPLNDTAVVGAEIRRRLEARTGQRIEGPWRAG